MVWSCVMIIITRNKLIGIALVGTIVIYSIGLQYLHAIFLIAGCVFMYCCFAHDILHDSNILNSFAYGSVCSFALITVHCIIDSSGRNHLGIVLLAVSLYFYSLFGISMSMFVVTICLVFKKKWALLDGATIIPVFIFDRSSSPGSPRQLPAQGSHRSGSSSGPHLPGTLPYDLTPRWSCQCMTLASTLAYMQFPITFK